MKVHVLSAMNGERTNNLSELTASERTASRAEDILQEPSQAVLQGYFSGFKANHSTGFCQLSCFKCVRGIIRSLRCILFSILKNSSDWFSQCSAKKHNSCMQIPVFDLIVSLLMEKRQSWLDFVWNPCGFFRSQSKGYAESVRGCKALQGNASSS